jgi:putative photosynthetic complex assembly protein
MSFAQTSDHQLSGGRRPRGHFTRLPLLAAAAAIAVSILGATAMQLAGGPASQPTTTALASRALHFADQADGGITVTDARDGHVVAVLPPGSNGFIRATMRTLAQRRINNDEGPDVPFLLTAWSDGRLTLDDPQSHRRIDLEAFGHTNEEAFADLLAPFKITHLPNL